MLSIWPFSLSQCPEVHLLFCRVPLVFLRPKRGIHPSVFHLSPEPPQSILLTADPSLLISLWPFHFSPSPMLSWGCEPPPTLSWVTAAGSLFTWSPVCMLSSPPSKLLQEWFPRQKRARGHRPTGAALLWAPHLSQTPSAGLRPARWSGSSPPVPLISPNSPRSKFLP